MYIKKKVDKWVPLQYTVVVVHVIIDVIFEFNDKTLYMKDDSELRRCFNVAYLLCLLGINYQI